MANENIKIMNWKNGLLLSTQVSDLDFEFEFIA